MLRSKRDLAARTLMVCLLVMTAAVASTAQVYPKVEIYGGYSWYDPNIHACTLFNGTTCLNTITLNSITKGFEGSSTFFFNHNVGLFLAGAGHFNSNANFATVMVGPEFKWHVEGIEPFIRAGVGLHRITPSSNSGVSGDWGFGAQAGGGIDVYAGKHLDIRLIQADFVYAHHNFAPALQITRDSEGARLGAGLVFKFGLGPPPVPPSANCAANPSEVFAGEPVTVTATAASFPKDRILTYAWTASGGAKTSGNAQSTQVDTTGLAPGSYTVTANVTGHKNEVATCNASFTVKERPKNPPTCTMSASAQTVKPGERINFSANASSPDQGVTISKTDWSVSAGTIASGQGTNQIAVDTSGLTGASVTATAQVTDSRGLTGACSATTNVEAPPPPPPPPPTASKLNEIQFKDARRPARVDNEAKAILDDVALRLQREPDAKAVIVGYHDPKEKGGDRLAQERATNTKAYLVKEKQIDASRIELRTSTSGSGKKADIYLVPAGATYDEPGTQTFTEKAPTKGGKKKAGGAAATGGASAGAGGAASSGSTKKGGSTKKKTGTTK
jgi:outer membrane protein OmpA-like peptidoglycan-associated protein